ncbi:hypothetical protein CDA63_15390 [Hymenobacter amundsenii]|uniref:HNH domain-containing protein n=1 Tax=Hymenobacter amundsenii TaxID=2006685 RepID=A0A246FI42_9BACT|nr:HNH endonuclease [Hymenobacter amundsenii]OWP62202.1 hypothetical protein CDA63_15390 [Hymenobacter amundsenii]
MRLTSSHDDIAANIKTLETYLHGNDAEARELAVGLLERGTYFIVAELNGAMRFYPSSFVGFQENSAKKHLKNAGSGVRATTGALEKTMRALPFASAKLNALYLEYARSVGIENPKEKPPYAKARRFWLTPGNSLNLSLSDFPNAANDHPYFPEGNAAARLHHHLDRRRKATEASRHAFIHEHGHLYCQVCSFDFEKTYGTTGIDYIEFHHTVPPAETTDSYKPKAEEYVLVCANCHRMLERHRPWLTLPEVKQVLG